MSTKDISRHLLQPQKHYTGIRMQQGRVLLDSDYNEGAGHDDEDQRRTTVEIIGPQASPGQGFALGGLFAVEPEPLRPGQILDTVTVELNGVLTTSLDYYLLPGSMYVGGLRVELEEAEQFVFQRDFLQVKAGEVPGATFDTSPPTGHFFYLHVWEQCVTAAEDEEIQERALGGPDTSVRVRRMRRAEFALANPGENCDSALQRVLTEKWGVGATFDAATGELRSPGRLWLNFLEGDAEDTCAPCHPDPTGRYLGAENQAIRILLADATHFVWAFDNAAPIYRASVEGVAPVPAGPVTVTLQTLPKDTEHWPLEGRVAEIIPWSAVLSNGEKVADQVGVFCRVSRSYDPATKTFLLDTTVNMAELNALVHTWDPAHPDAASLNHGDEPRLFYVRFWHQTAPGTGVTIPTSSTAALGSTGIQPFFTAAGLRGDYWVAALRPETPDRIVPFDLHLNEDGVPPHGARHFYSPLGLVEGTGTTISAVEDCRIPLRRLNDSGCCTHTVGDGVHSFGDFTSIQAAINALPPQGGKVCIRRGTYFEEVVVANRAVVVLSGCGRDTVLRSPEVVTRPALLEANGGFYVAIEGLTLESTAQRGLWVQGGNEYDVSDVYAVAVPPPPASPAVIDDEPVIFVGSSGHVRLSEIDIRPSRRQALHSEGIFRGDYRAVRIQSFYEVTLPPPTKSLVLLKSSGLHAVEGLSIQSTSRAGVVVDGTGFRARNLDIRIVEQAGHPIPGPTLDLGDGTMSVEDSYFSFNGISDHAVVSLRGFVDFRNNFVLSSGSNWGGVNVRGYSNDQVISGNRIIGGRGHGITLGSVLWYPAGSDPNTASRREGPGKAQLLVDGKITGDLRNGFVEGGVQYLPHSEAIIANLKISDNLILGVGANGISVLTLLGLPDSEYLFIIDKSVISGNRIRSCGNGAAPLVPLAAPLFPIGGSREGSLPGYQLPMRVLPYAAICLANAPSCEISGNVVEGFGDSAPRTVPLSGIVVLFGTRLLISGNRLTNVGTPIQSGDVLLAGLRAGIAIVLGGLTVPTKADVAAALVVVPGEIPALATRISERQVRVIDNEVCQSEGRALFLVSTGSIDVQNNYLASLGFHGSTSSPEALADIRAIGDVVFVQNLGRPLEAFNLPAGGSGDGEPANNSIPQYAIAYLRNLLPDYGYAGLTLFFVGYGGLTSFTGNEVIYDWNVKQRSTSEPLSYAPRVSAS